ncbi:MAG: TIGR04086 family membrane protein [Oscillospiraceae bacterium]|nr:TIGR04086 family membrane protein [Oscillospiraceae bacterium]
MKGKRAAGKKAFVLSILFGAAVSLVVYFVALALAARLVLSGAVGEDRLIILMCAAAFIAAFAGGMSAVLRYRFRALLTALAAALAFFVALYILGFILYDDLSLGKYGLFILAAALIGGAVSGLSARSVRVGKKHKISQKRLKKT